MKNKTTQFNDDPINLLIEDLEGDNHKVAVSAIKCLYPISQLIKEERTQNELLPYLLQYCKLDPNTINYRNISFCLEIYSEIAKTLNGDFIKYVRKDKSAYINNILKILKVLGTMEEPNIRENSIKSICSILNTIEDIEERYKLGTEIVIYFSEEDFFISKITSIGIIIFLLEKNCEKNNGKIQTFKITLINILINYSKSDIMLLKKKGISTLCNIITKIGKNEILNNLYPLFIELKDEDIYENIQVLVLNLAGKILMNIEDDKLISEIISYLKQMSKNNLYGVKEFFVRKTFPDLYKSNSINVEQLNILFTNYMNLLNDHDENVKIAILESSVDVLKNMGNNEQITLLINKILDTRNDDNIKIKVTLANIVIRLYYQFDNAIIKKNVLNSIILLVNNDNIEIVMGVVEGWNLYLPKGTTIGFAKIFLPFIIKHTNSENWRLRLSILNLLNKISKNIKECEFNKYIHGTFIKFLEDPVNKIRIVACNMLVDISIIYGLDWTVNNLLNEIFILKSSNKYLIRMVPLIFINNIYSKLTESDVESFFIAPVLELIDDKIINVRIYASKTLKNIINKLNLEVIKEKIVPVLRSINNEVSSDIIKLIN